MDEAITVLSAPIAKTILNLDDVLLLQKSCWRILKLSHLQNGLLGARATHADSFLSACCVHGRTCSCSHTTCLSQTHLLAVGKLLLSDRFLKLVFGNSDAVSAEAVVNRVVLDNGSIHGKQVQTACRVSVLKIGWEAEGKDHIHRNLRANELENGRSLRDGEQEDISLLVSR